MNIQLYSVRDTETFEMFRAGLFPCWILPNELRMILNKKIRFDKFKRYECQKWKTKPSKQRLLLYIWVFDDLY